MNLSNNKPIGKGKHGIVYNLNEFNIINKNNIKNIELFSVKNKDNLIIDKSQDINELFNYMHKTKNKIVKIFKTNRCFMKNSYLKNDFYQELKINKKILNIYKSKKYLTIYPIGKFKSVKLIGSIITLNNDKKIYMIFGNKCENENFKINLNKYIIDILESIIILQKHNLQHDDIKIDNIVKCSNKYKLIDWGKVCSVKDLSFRTIYGIYHSPILLYLKGYKFIDFILLIEKFNYNYNIVNSKKNKNFLRKNKNFQDLLIKIKNEIKIIIKINENKKKLLNRYKFTFDIFMFGIAILHLINKHNLNYNKYKPIIDKFTSLIDPVENAQDALKYTKFILKI